VRVELLMVGAHNGSKQRRTILDHAKRGPVILVEPVPHLFSRLADAFGNIHNIQLEQKCVAEKAGRSPFFAPSPNANNVAAWGDQLGSMNRDHAARHGAALAAHVSEIEVDCITFQDLVSKYRIDGLGTLFTDTEGFDTIILPTFPFDRVMPDQIIFEYKHADGTFNIGRNFGMLLCLLDVLGYNIRIVDDENCVAVRRR
jgi:FkbM family methyltransferase